MIVTRMELIHVKVEKEVNDKLENLVKSKVYKNKSEAVRDMLEEHMHEHPELFVGDELNDILKEAEKMSDKEFEERMAEGLKGPKSAAELVSEGRGAY
jgi:Arc/MetJ-type ribon-helix-helix transcriptional regulator